MEAQEVVSASTKSSRRSVKKRVVSVPVVDASPPSDLWAWRKYGQKPIKGSPYPRGYYRCSSSKGCPARKQVERNRVDPTTFIVTYSSDHDHHRPAAAKNNRHHKSSPAGESALPGESENIPAKDQDEKLTDLTVDDSYGWFAQVGSPSDAAIFCSPLLGFDDCEKLSGKAADEEEEALFAGLGELPEYSIVFRRGFVDRQWRAAAGDAGVWS